MYGANLQYDKKSQLERQHLRYALKFDNTICMVMIFCANLKPKY